MELNAESKGATLIMLQKESKTSANKWMDAWQMNEECDCEAGHVTSLSLWSLFLFPLFLSLVSEAFHQYKTTNSLVIGMICYYLQHY